MANKKRITQVKRLQLIARAREVMSNLESANEHLTSKFAQLGIQPFTTWNEFGNWLTQKFISILDFVNGDLKIFNSRSHLIRYLFRTNKFYDKTEAKEQNLGHFLVRIFV